MVFLAPIFITDYPSFRISKFKPDYPDYPPFNPNGLKTLLSDKIETY